MLLYLKNRFSHTPISFLYFVFLLLLLALSNNTHADILTDVTLQIKWKYIAVSSVTVTVLIVSWIAIIFFRLNRNLAKKISESTRFDFAMRGSNDGLWDWNYRTGEVFYSERWMSMVGYQPGELKGTVDTWLKLCHSDEVPVVLELIEAISKGTEDSYTVKFHMRHKDGHWVPILSRAYAIRDPSTHEVVRFVGTHIDLTEQEKAGKELNRAVFLLNMAQKLSRAGSWHMDYTEFQDRFFWSPTTAEIFGYPYSEGENYILSKDWEENAISSNKELGGKAAALFAAALEDPEVTYDATFQVTKAVDGKVIWVRSVADIVRDESGQITNVYGMCQDVTEHKQHEEELAVAKDAAEGVSRAKSEFLANMSHEIRTPMNAIMGLSDLALHTDLNNKQHDYIDKVHRSAESLLGIINDILDFSKIEAGQLDMEVTDFRLEDVLDNLKNVLSLKTDETGVALAFDVPSDLPVALIGDPLRLGQILINLGGNAAKFTEAGMIEISVKKVSQSDNQINLQFSIKDTGIGMSQRQQDRLFKAFNQADSSTTRKYGGTGLGMTISKHLVQMMGGKIWVESAEGVGSTVHFTVNMGIQQNVVSTEQHKQQKADDVNRAIEQLRGARILLVEDNEFNQVLTLHVLSSNGLIPTLAKNGQQALDMLASQDFDGVLMDCQMPVMDGYVATQEIRKQAKYRDMPVLAMTANAMAGDREKVLAAGMNAHIAKPFTRDELFTTMAQWVVLDR